MNHPTKNTVLGTLVDRAVCMPYAKPTALRGGCSVLTGLRIVDDVCEAADFLVEALADSDAAENWSPARLAVDPAGVWWSKPLHDFITLVDDAGPEGGPAETAQQWVRRRLRIAARRAGEALQECAEAEGWQWLWSQPSFASPGDRIPRIVRPDLVAGTGTKQCLVIDLKTSRARGLRGVIRDTEKQAEDFRVWARHLSGLGFEPIESWVLAVSSRARLKAENGPAARWENYTAGAQ